MLNTELWRPAPGFEQDYEVSSHGRIRRSSNVGPTHAGRIKVLSTDKQGYVRTRLSVKSVMYAVKVHRLVASAFIGQIPEGMTVNHLNGDKSDNRVENLEVVTRAENVQHMFRVLKARTMSGEKNTNAKLTASDVVAIRAAVANGEKRKALAARYGVSMATVHDLMSGRSWSQHV